MANVGFLVVSQSITAARGVIGLAEPLAPGVAMEPCCSAAPNLSEAVKAIERDAVRLSARLGESARVLIIADLGSSAMAVQQFLAEQDSKQFLRAKGPFLEGLVAGAVAVQQGAGASEALRACTAALQFFDVDADSAQTSEIDESGQYKVCVRVSLEDGLSARPAAVIARVVSDSQSVVTINNTDATSVLALMRLGIKCGESVDIIATGFDSVEVVERIVATLTTV